MPDKILHYEFSCANYLGVIEPGSKDWDDARRDRIGGSEVGAITGESKYESAYSLWAKKLGLIPSDKADNEPMYWGRKLESVVIDRFEEDHPELIVGRTPGSYVSKERDFMFASPDAIYTKADGSRGVLEIKTARYKDDWTDGVPRYYMTQVQWYLSTLGLEEAYLAVLFAGSEYQEFYIEADPLWQAYDLEQVEKFVECVREKKRPDWDGSEATVTAVRTQHPEINLESSVELGDLGMYYVLALEEIEEKKAEANKMLSEILDYMGDARTGIVHDIPVFTRQARAGGIPYLVRKKSR